MNRLIQRASPLTLSVALVSASLLIAFALPTPVKAAEQPLAPALQETPATPMTCAGAG